MREWKPSLGIFKVSLLLDRLAHLFLLAVTLSLPIAALFTRQVMDGVLEVVHRWQAFLPFFPTP